MRDLDAKLSRALDSRGYVEKSYYAVPGGFAIGTRLEQIDDSGRPKTEPARWASSPGPINPFSLGAYVRALFTAPKGRYRIIVFIVTATPFGSSGKTVSADEAQKWLSAGLNKLPPSIGAQPYTPDVTTTALIYEFERVGDSTATPAHEVTQSSIPGQEHLVNAGIWAALGG